MSDDMTHESNPGLIPDSEVPSEVAHHKEEILSSEVRIPTVLTPAVVEGVSLAKVESTQPNVRVGSGQGQTEQSGGRAPKGYTRRGFLRGAVAFAGVGLAGGIGAFLATRGSEDTGERSAQPTQAPGISSNNTPENGISSPSPTQTQEITPSPTEEPNKDANAPSPEEKERIESLLDRYYVPIAKESITSMGGTVFALSEEILKREGASRNEFGVRTDAPFKRIVSNSEISDAEERIEDAYEKWTFYNAWANLRGNKLSSQANILPVDGESDEAKKAKRDEFWTRVQNGEDFRYPMQAYGEEGPQEYTKELWVNPKNRLFRVSLPNGENTTIVVTVDFKVNHTVIDETLIIGNYNGASEGQLYKGTPEEIPDMRLGVAAGASWDLPLVGDKISMDQLKKQTYVTLGNLKSYEPKQIEVVKILVPNFQKVPQKEWESVIYSQ